MYKGIHTLNDSIPQDKAELPPYGLLLEHVNGEVREIKNYYPDEVAAFNKFHKGYSDMFTGKLLLNEDVIADSYTDIEPVDFKERYLIHGWAYKDGRKQPLGRTHQIYTGIPDGSSPTAYYNPNQLWVTVQW